MADIKINGATPSAFYFGSTAATAVYYGSTNLWDATPALPAGTIRCKFSTGYTPAIGDSQTLVDASENIWDIYKSGNMWSNLFVSNTALVSVIAANTTGVRDMGSMFNGCSNLETVPLFDTSSVATMESMFNNCSKLTSVPLFDTSSVTSMIGTFSGCYNVQSGALALYQQASTQATPPILHFNTFTNCGISTLTGLEELNQIPTSWGGLQGS